MLLYSSTLKSSAHDSILVSFILVSVGTLYLTELGIPFTLCVVFLESDQMCNYILEYCTEAKMCKP